MTPHLQRCMKQARDFPNTATVDILIAAIEQSMEMVQAAERMAAAVEREECAKVAESASPLDYPCVIADRIRARDPLQKEPQEGQKHTAGEQEKCPNTPPS